MRLSCNGCRILRKGCSDNCTIRPCLQWINSPESQANATLFLAKFYGRAGLLNLINAAPQHLRPAVFQSLLYESCGRIVNPVYGSMGLFWTGEWARCQAAVDAVLTGMEIGNGVEVSDWQGKETAATHGSDHVLAACDIRHVSTESHVEKEKEKEKGDVNKVKGRARFKRGGEGPKGKGGEKVKVIKPKPRVGWVDSSALLWKPVPDHPSESESVFSGETVEASLMNRDEPERERGENNENRADEPGIDLDLTLGYGDLIR